MDVAKSGKLPGAENAVDLRVQSIGVNGSGMMLATQSVVVNYGIYLASMSESSSSSSSSSPLLRC